MKIQWALALSVSVLSVASLQGCATNGPPRFPDPQSASPKGGTFVNVANLRNVGSGLNKDQMFDLLGPPHFNEWFVGSHTWNYLFDFRRGNEVVSCQYQVRYDEHMKVSNTYWRDPACADFVRTPSAAPVAAAEPPAAPIEQFTLQSDALFAFGQSSLESMQPGGQAQLDDAVERIKRHKAITRIAVVGHTDRIGTPAVNDPLSRARAQTVRRYLIAHGLDGNVIEADGVGSREPVTHCPPGQSRAVIACLQPDRRVTIAVSGRD
ncbi:outer membrane protein assembly factor BamE [Burkholderia cenocepacia]|nr:outer membrane protein assembly factor BamE [Burkholderia cenocepacia]RQU90216.1 outer membrane protein assembly factor BamE [Burkholderia cenocepacia]RQV30697.1 outer membrane protein assembly factor BamE [Burkholderia cenocepacia]RQV76435.1 outer membrane protein assembly factor BamE [Burkholderia cenocepacia]RQZ96214.1 outer membrane protein assembly factor BamE [Burkholderia cenocepacia]